MSLGKVSPLSIFVPTFDPLQQLCREISSLPDPKLLPGLEQRRLQQQTIMSSAVSVSSSDSLLSQGNSRVDEGVEPRLKRALIESKTFDVPSLNQRLEDADPLLVKYTSSIQSIENLINQIPTEQLSQDQKNGPLIRAINSGSVPIVKKLVDKGVPLIFFSNNFFCNLSISNGTCALGKEMGTVDRVLIRAAFGPLVCAVANPSLEVTKILLQRVAQELTSDCLKTKGVLLEIAIAKRDYHLLQLLLEAGVDPLAIFSAPGQNDEDDLWGSNPCIDDFHLINIEGAFAALIPSSFIGKTRVPMWVGMSSQQRSEALNILKKRTYRPHLADNNVPVFVSCGLEYAVVMGDVRAASIICRFLSNRGKFPNAFERTVCRIYYQAILCINNAETLSSMLQTISRELRTDHSLSKYFQKILEEEPAPEASIQEGRSLNYKIKCLRLSVFKETVPVPCGLTPLMFAAEIGRPVAVDCLLKLDPNSVNKRISHDFTGDIVGISALTEAVSAESESSQMKDRIKVIEMLIDANACMNHITEDARTPLALVTDQLNSAYQKKQGDFIPYFERLFSMLLRRQKVHYSADPWGDRTFLASLIGHLIFRSSFRDSTVDDCKVDSKIILEYLSISPEKLQNQEDPRSFLKKSYLNNNYNCEGSVLYQLLENDIVSFQSDGALLLSVKTPERLFVLKTWLCDVWSNIRELIQFQKILSGVITGGIFSQSNTLWRGFLTKGVYDPRLHIYTANFMPHFPNLGERLKSLDEQPTGSNLPGPGHS